MNVSTLIGFLLAAGVFLGATMLGSTSFGIFLNLHAALIVLGGTLSASFVCFSLPKVAGLTRVFVRRMLGKSKRDYIGLINEIVELSQASRKGRAAVEAQAKKIGDPFLRDAAQILFWLESEVPEEELRDLLEARAETHLGRYLDEAGIFRTMAKFPPAFGLMGTTLGMIALLQTLGAQDSKNLIGPSMSVALVATLYGIMLANFVFIPIAENLTKQSKEDFVARRMVVEGVMMIAKEMPTKFVEERVKSYLLPSERGGGETAGSDDAGGGRKAA